MKHVLANGLRATYEVEGEGPDVLLIHGWMASRKYWREAAERLSGFRTWAVDLYGFGDSEKPATGYNLEDYSKFLIGFLDAVKVRRCAVVGHSMGGAIAAWTVMSHLTRFVSLGLVNAALAGIVRTPLPWASEPAMRMFMRLADTSRSIGQITIASMCGVRAPESRIILEEARKADILAASLCGEMMSKPTDWRGLSFLKIPAITIYGENDFLVSRGMDREIESMIPGVKTRYLKGCGHLPMLEKPAEFYALLKAFLENR